MRRVLVVLVAALVFAAPAAGDVIEKKQSVDSRIAHLRDRVEAAKSREAALQREIDVGLDADPFPRTAGRRRLPAPRPPRARARAPRVEAQPPERPVPGPEPAPGVPSDRVADGDRPAQPAAGRGLRGGAHQRGGVPPLGAQLLRPARRARLHAHDRALGQADRGHGHGGEGTGDGRAPPHAACARARPPAGGDRRGARAPGACPPRPAGRDQGPARVRPRAEEGRPRHPLRERAGGRVGDRRARPGQRRAGREDPGGAGPFDGHARRRPPPA